MEHELVKNIITLKTEEQYQKTTENQILDSQAGAQTSICFQSAGQKKNQFPTVQRNYYAFSILLLVKYLHSNSS